MQYISTRGQTRPHTFSEAVEAGLAPDGGLFLPEHMPDISGRLGDWASLSYARLAAEFLSLFAPEIAPDEWHALTARAYSKFDSPEVAPLRKITGKTYVLELWHGPTLAFKDFALQLLGLLYKRQVERSGKRLAVLGATSGDTGSAAIHGCIGQEGIHIFILYPHGRVAPLQERQMACTGADNVFAIPVPGTFDDAQSVVKECFGDAAFTAAHNLSAVNSINIARVLAQCVYYIWAWLRLRDLAGQGTDAAGGVEFVVPTGNFGNVLAGWMARQMGLPVRSFRVATNQNDILHRYFTSGDYRQGDVRPSHAPSMDIQAASNFERYLYFLLESDPAKVREVMARLKNADAVNLPAADPAFRSTSMKDDQIIRVIAQMWKDWRYVIDPHTACAFTGMATDCTSIVLSTAHPAKFPDVVKQATGMEPVHPTLEALKSLPLVTHRLPASAAEVKSFIARHS
ncbi:MAG: threonine synthase [Verrucomicrobiaceae bacterium]|nr:threonine synthase [Verrucomicrobiaceae bacterium]